MMSYKLLTTIVVIILLFLNIITLRVLKNNSDSQNEAKNSQFVENQKILEERMHFLFSLNTQSFIKDSIIIQISKDNPAFLSEFRNHENIVVFIQKGACGSCIMRLFIDLDILSKSIGYDRILVATDMNINGQPIINSDFPFKHFYIVNRQPNVYQ